MLTAAVWLMALLGPPVQGWWGLSPAADDDASQLGCGSSFFTQTFPQGEGSALKVWCHGKHSGPKFATLHRPDCHTAVALAIRLGPGWLLGQEFQEEEILEKEDGVKVFVPAFLRRNYYNSPPTDSHFLHWDWSVSTIIRSHVAHECNDRNGELYILTGVGARWAEGCQVKPQWSAVCCSVPDAEGGFSVGFISKDDDGGTVLPVSVKELQEKLGVEGLFSGGCVGEDMVGVTQDLYTGADIEKLAANLAESFRIVSDADESGSDASNSDTSHLDSGKADISHSDVRDSDTSQSDTSHLDSRNADISHSDISDSDTSHSDTSPSDTRNSDTKEADVTEDYTVETESSSIEAAEEKRYVESVTEQVDEAESNSSSIVVFILSTTLSILKAPLRPIFSRITQFPGQVLYVLQEDLGVLTALPGDTFSFFYLLVSDLLSWIRWAFETLLDMLMDCIYGLYYCSSSMLAELLNSCYTGVTGVGTLTGDTVGICGDVVGNTWWVSKFFGGRLLRQSGDYAGTVAMEMGDQALALGGGTGRLAWRSVVGVFNVFFTGGSIVFGVLDVVFGAFTEGFGQEMDTTPLHTNLLEAE
ncbi:uncharacterized protein LOC130915158 [Corythoichthys intestinalis]|uniref:uncharacterized protein LOC130915158 n=1 Tax=Corythoichthys intestinalis TaxID=161448 RepID=UPI0025A4D943|nr:uncharacterized protein LOC130915158 [Corythoichthys intestinalis]